MIKLYSESNCEGVRTLAPKIDPNTLRPNVLAIFAYCEPHGFDSEKLFALAEERAQRET